MSTGAIVLIVAVIVVAAIVWMIYTRRKRTAHLKSTFGPEYDRAVAESSDRRRAEEILDRRQKRVQGYHLRALRPEERERFAEAWRIEQERFVDDPRTAVARADELVSDAMTARGYRIPDLRTRMEDLSVQHPAEVEHFRAAHEIATRDARGQAGTEDLRQAMQHYRAIFETILDQKLNAREEVRQ